jgi:hypothetical protein
MEPKQPKNRSDFEHQSLAEYLYPSSIIDQAKTTLVNMKLEDNTSLLLEVLEIIGALTISLPMCTTPAQVASQLVLSIRAMTKGSITEAIFTDSRTLEWVKEIFGYNVFEPQSGLGTAEEWLSSLPNLQENWSALRGSPAFEKISNVISLAASIGLCSVTNLSWSVKGIEIFRAGSINKHANALDFFGAILDTVILFIEGGYECFKKGSFRPLLFSSDEGRKFDDLYFTLIELHEHAMVFNLHTKPIDYDGEHRPISDLEYGRMLDSAIELASSAYKTAKGTWQQGTLEKRLTVLRVNRAAYAAKRISGTMRYAPWCVYIWGPSDIGKSTVAQILMADCLNAAQSSPDPLFTATLKETDKFDSTLKGDTNGIYLDDLGNTKLEFCDQSPCARIIDIKNNMITYANKADLHEKGKVEIRPGMLVITSNAPLVTHAKAASIEPFSIVRRGDLHVKVAVKEQFATSDGRLFSEKALTHFNNDSLANDVWDLECYIPKASKKGGDMRMLAPADGSVAECKPMSILETLRLATTMCKKHFELQRLLVKRAEGLIASRHYCKTCFLCSDLCECIVPEPIVEETEKQSSLSETFEHLQSQMLAVPSYLSYCIEGVPAAVVSSPLVRKCYLLYHGKDFLEVEYQARCDFAQLYLGMIFMLLLSQNFTFFYCFAFFVFCFISYLTVLAKWRDVMCDKLASKQFATGELFESIRKSKATQFFSVCVLGKMIHSLVVMMKTSHMVNQTSMAPVNVEEIQKRDTEVNPWATAIPATLHVNDRSATMTHEQVISRVKKNLFHAKFVENGFQQTCDLLALGGTVFLMPLHVFENRKDMKVLVTKSAPHELNSYFRGFVSVSTMVPIPGKDLCIVSIPSGGVHADIMHLFPESSTVTGTGQMLYRNEDGSLRDDLVRIEPVADSESGGPGYSYTAAYTTFRGLCMATIVGKFAKSCIAGLHLRGIPHKPDGLALTVSEKELRDAVKEAHVIWKSSFPCHVNGTLPKTRYDKNILTNQEIHPKSPINFLPLGSNLEFVGQTGMRASYTKSEVIDTPISAAVTAVTGVPNNYGPPKFHRWEMWQKSLAHSANPSAGIEPSLIDRAVTDYITEIIDTFQSPAFKDMVTSELHLLSPMETLCGRDNARFIDAMKRSTSKGYPLSGPKSDLITLLNPEDFPEFQCPAVMDDEVLEQVEIMKNELRAGRRCYSIFKACVKDEPTKVTSDKVRVFQAIDVASQCIIRESFLPIVRLFSLFPFLTECAVGINAEGPEWDQMAKHISKFGSERIFAGDYSKYDLRMPADLIIAAFKCLIMVAEQCGDYTPDDIVIMKGVATEIAFSCVSYNGDMLIHHGSNPSGQNLTVYINCIVNSLLLRCGYYHLYPALQGNPEPFRHNVVVIIYGDDFKGSVREGCDWFNHISYANFLKARDMILTMPDKSSTPTPYMSDSAADFLKRHNHLCEETGLIHGVLDEASIFKSLHSVLASKVVSALDQSAMNIDGALREWWLYGKEMYEMRREQMTKVAVDSSISHMCSELNVTYEDRLDKFNSKYERQCGIEVPFNEDDHCWGTVYSRFFWWEFYMAKLTFPFLLVLWYYVAMDRVTFKFTGLDRRWLLFMYRGSIVGWLPWLFMLYFNTYFVPACIKKLIWIWQAPARADAERDKRRWEAERRQHIAYWKAYEAEQLSKESSL